jgi:glutamine amidotransferase
MSAKVTIVDYGIGNLFSVARSLEKCGAQVVLGSKPDEIAQAQRLVLPGVGAFCQGMQGLRERDLIEPILDFAASGRPLLGICLGMQMLFSSSTEFGEHQGLGLIDGQIIPIEPKDETGHAMKVPHIGWTPLVQPPGRSSWQGSVLKNLTPGTYAYFVHSFTAEPTHEVDRLADAHYGSARISAAVQRNNIFGCQFHPEKSASAGLRIVQSFLEL